MSEPVHERLTQRPTAEQLEFYRAWADGNARLPVRDRAPGTEWIADLIAELDAVTQEREQWRERYDQSATVVRDLRKAIGDFMSCHDSGSFESEGQAFDALRAVYDGWPSGSAASNAGPIPEERCPHGAAVGESCDPCWRAKKGLDA